MKHFSPFNSMFWMFSLYIILSVTACNMSSYSHPYHPVRMWQQTCIVLVIISSFAFFLYFLFHPLLLFLSYSSLFTSPLSPALSLRLFLQSLSATQTQALSCMESLCCYQHGQSGCSRLAHLLEQMTGQCRASANHCHASSNRWGGRQQQMILNPDEPSPPLGCKNLGCMPEGFSS